MMIQRNNNVILRVLCGIIILLGIMWFRTQQASVYDVMEQHTTELTPLEQAFYATGAELQDVHVSAWVRLVKQDQNVDGLTKVAKEAATVLADSVDNIELHTSAGHYHTTVQAVGKTMEQNIIITAQAIYPLEKQQETREVYLTVNVEQKGNNVDVKALEEKIMAVIMKNGNQFSITTCLSGWVSGKLEEEKMTQVIRQAFQRVRAHVVEGISSPHFVNFAGMTEAIDRSVTVGKKNINLNIAMRHHSTENRTFVTAATPIITGEY